MAIKNIFKNLMHVYRNLLTLFDFILIMKRKKHFKYFKGNARLSVNIFRRKTNKEQ